MFIKQVIRRLVFTLFLFSVGIQGMPLYWQRKKGSRRAGQQPMVFQAMTIGPM